MRADSWSDELSIHTAAIQSHSTPLCQADQAIGRYMDGFYNPVRRHSALDFTSPAQFEKTVAE